MISGGSICSTEVSRFSKFQGFKGKVAARMRIETLQPWTLATLNVCNYGTLLP
jgi:hypothetical protein